MKALLQEATSRMREIAANKRVRKLAGRIAYVFYVAAFVEISLQVFYYVMAGDFLFNRTAPALYQSEPYGGYMNRPGISFDHRTSEFEAHYYINNAGLRVPRPGLEYAPTKPAGTYRILLLGPSFAYGWGVDYEKSFANLLPMMLAKQDFANGRRIELIDAGVPSLEPSAQLNWYKHVGKKYQPDLVIQFIYASMAVTSRPQEYFAANAEGYLIQKNLPPGYHWRERAKKFATVFYGWVLWTDFEAWRNPSQTAQNGSVQGAGRQFVQAAKFDASKPVVRDAIVFYRNLAQAVTDSGARLQIVYFPLSYVIHQEDEARWRHVGVYDVAAEKAFDAAFVRYLNKESIPAVDITEDLRAAATHGKRLYYWLDIHWTPEGNAAAARAVANTLIRAK